MRVPREAMPQPLPASARGGNDNDMNAQIAVLRTTFVMMAVLLPTRTTHAREIKPIRHELKAKQAWLEEHLLNCKLVPSPTKPVATVPPPVEPGLDVYANHDPVTQNARGGHHMKIGDQEYTRGLYCHAISQVAVHLPGPGKSFTAVVGLDHNEDTARGKGSVVFTVKVKDKVAFQSEVMRYGTPGRKVNVELGGAEEFTLEIGDAGDGIGWDQSDWCDAKATLADGKELWLGDMPLRDRRAEAAPPPIVRTSALPISFVYGGQSSDELAGGVAEDNRPKETGFVPHPAHAHLDRCPHRPGGPLCRRGIQRFPGGRMDRLLQEHRPGGHPHSGKPPGARREV